MYGELNKEAQHLTNNKNVEHGTVHYIASSTTVAAAARVASSSATFTEKN